MTKNPNHGTILVRPIKRNETAGKLRKTTIRAISKRPRVIETSPRLRVRTSLGKTPYNASIQFRFGPMTVVERKSGQDFSLGLSFEFE
jgi:hypothetical protein